MFQEGDLAVVETLGNFVCHGQYCFICKTGVNNMKVLHFNKEARGRNNLLINPQEIDPRPYFFWLYLALDVSPWGLRMDTVIGAIGPGAMPPFVITYR